jgi:hypothetical protein
MSIAFRCKTGTGCGGLTVVSTTLNVPFQLLPPPPPAAGCGVVVSFLTDPFILLKTLPANFTGECEAIDSTKGQKWEGSNEKPEIKVGFCIDVGRSEPIPYSVHLDKPQPQSQPAVPVKLMYSNFAQG